MAYGLLYDYLSGQTIDAHTYFGCHFTDEQYNKWLKNSAIQNRIAANKEKQKQRLEQEAKYIRELGYIPPRKETRGRPRKVVNE